MGKKRKASGRQAQPSGPAELDIKDARLGPITTYEDVADSEDEYFLGRDRIMLDDEPGSKRRRKDDDDIELSDDEVLGYSDDSDDVDEDDAIEPLAAKKKPSDDDEDDEEQNDDEEEDAGWWGSTKREYYNADNIETEADAAEEEAEAKRLQQKKLSKMAEEDFIFDEGEWLNAEPEAEDEHETVIEVLKDVEIPQDMSPQDRLGLLRSRYPEFEHLVKEFQDAQPMLSELKAISQKTGETSLGSVKYWVLGCYVASLASYFAILTSPARDSSGVEKLLDPSELRDHEVMETLIRCRDAWKKVKTLSSLNSTMEVLPTVMDAKTISYQSLDEIPKKSKKKSSKQAKAEAEKKARKLQQAQVIEDSVADLYNLPLGGRKTKRRTQSTAATAQDDTSDFGEEETLDVRAAAEKAARKKSLKFYTSQIVQKANKRADAGRDAGGDVDIPYRERLRDRQARLLSQAEKRGRKESKHGAVLGDDSDEDESTAANTIRGNADDYYDMVAQASTNKKEGKAARYAAYALARKSDRVVEKEEVGADGKRKINYAIEKNKGLAPRRKKENRNPRVKKRMQYESKQKKLRSMMPTWKGGEPKGGYKGEISGINPGVIKSVKL